MSRANTQTTASRETLRGYFENGKKPTQDEFAALIDSLVHQDDSLDAFFAGNKAETGDIEADTTVDDKYMTPLKTMQAVDTRRANADQAAAGDSHDVLMTPRRTDEAIIALTRLSRVPGLSREVDAKIQAAISRLVDGAPGALNTLNELAAALNEDENAYNTLMRAIDAHANRRDNPHGVTKTQVGLGNLPNNKSDRYDEHENEPTANSFSSTVLATTRAVSRLRAYLLGLINGKMSKSGELNATGKYRFKSATGSNDFLIDGELGIGNGRTSAYAKIDMNHNPIQELKDGSSPYDAVNKRQLDSKLNNLPNAKSDSYNLANSAYLATSRAVSNLYNYLLGLINGKMSKAGGTMTGDLDMGANQSSVSNYRKITRLKEGSSPHDAVNKRQLDALNAKIPLIIKQVDNVSNTWLSTGHAFGNVSGVWVLTLICGRGSVISTAAYIIVSASYAKTITLLGLTGNHNGHGVLYASLSQSGAAPTIHMRDINIYVRFSVNYNVRIVTCKLLKIG